MKFESPARQERKDPRISEVRDALESYKKTHEKLSKESSDRIKGMSHRLKEFELDDIVEDAEMRERQDAAEIHFPFLHELEEAKKTIERLQASIDRFDSIKDKVFSRYEKASDKDIVSFLGELDFIDDNLAELPQGLNLEIKK